MNKRYRHRTSADGEIATPEYLARAEGMARTHIGTSAPREDVWFPLCCRPSLWDGMSQRNRWPIFSLSHASDRWIFVLNSWFVAEAPVIYWGATNWRQLANRSDRLQISKSPLVSHFAAMSDRIDLLEIREWRDGAIAQAAGRI